MKIKVYSISYSNRHQRSVILYDIYCLMLLKYFFEGFGIAAIRSPTSVIAAQRCNCLEITGLPFVPTISVFMRRPWDTTPETNSTWPISLPVQCFARSRPGAIALDPLPFDLSYLS